MEDLGAEMCKNEPLGKAPGYFSSKRGSGGLERWIQNPMDYQLGAENDNFISFLWFRMKFFFFFLKNFILSGDTSSCEGYFLICLCIPLHFTVF